VSPMAIDNYGVGTTYTPPPNPMGEEEMRDLYNRAAGRAKEITPEQFQMMTDAAIEARRKATEQIFSDNLATIFGDVNIREYAKQFIAEHYRSNPGRMSLNGNPVLFLFISSSMPVQTLRSFAISMNNVPQTVVFVMRGFIGGMKKIQPTIEFIQSWANWKEEETPRFGVMIDPVLFRKYNVRQVPTLVYDPSAVPEDFSDFSESKDLQNHPDGRPVSPLHDPVPEDSYVSVSGDVSLDYLIERIYQETRSEYLAYLVNKMRTNQFYGGS